MIRKTVLLVEDSDKDAELITMAMKKSYDIVKLERARDGAEAIEFLQRIRETDFNPALVLLDIKLPRMNGIEVLSRIKLDEKTRSIPVVMFTSSREDCDMKECYNIGANAYIVKPFDFNELMNVLKSTENFWCHVNETIDG